MGLHWRMKIGKICHVMKQDYMSPLKPDAGKVLLQAVVPLAVGVYFLHKGRPVASGILMGLGGILLISGFLIPALFRQIETLGQWFGRTVSVTITWILLTVTFYLVFVPGRLILKLRGIDPMCRQFPTRATTYWVPRKPVAGVDQYNKQY